MVGLEEDKRSMRQNQVSILIERFNDSVPADYPCDIQRINVYCDDSASIYAALAKAHALAVNELNEYESIGVRSYVSTNEFANDYRDMHGVNSKEKSNYDDDLELQFTYESGKLRKDRIWAYENFDEIMQVIRMNDDKKELKLRLKEKFGLDDIQIRKLLSMRLDMFTEHDYLMDLEEQNNNNHKSWEPKQMVQYYERIIREAKKQIDEYKTYIMISENYQDMIELLAQNPDFTSYASLMREKYGFDGTQSRMVKLITVADIVSKEKFLEKIEKLEKDIAWYEDCIKEQKDVEE